MESFFCVLGIGIIVLIVSAIVARIVYSIAKKEVTNNSEVVKQLEALSKKYEFHSIKSPYTHNKIQKSVSAFNKMNYENELIDFLREHQHFFADKIQKAQENATNYELYCYEFDKIKNGRTIQWKSRLKNKIEEDLIEELKSDPVCKVKITIGNKYTSPKGRNSYYDSRTFSQSKIVKAFKSIEDQDLFEMSRQEERSKMSESLRYDILKRDGFKCVICGASAQDGAKLHVDHILPVSKGGKTINSNLRTLCSRCNLGKSDKYDPSGVN
jgi:hypothetical protein